MHSALPTHSQSIHNTATPPQAQQAKAAQIKAQTPEKAVVPNAPSQEDFGGVESLSAAKASPLMEALSGKSTTPEMPTQNYAPVPQFAMPTPLMPNYLPLPQFAMPAPALVTQSINPYLAQLLAALSQAQAAQQLQRMYPNRLIYV